MKAAIIYDRVNKWGGAERDLLALHEIFPEAPLFTAVYSPQNALWAKVFPKVIPSFLQKIPFARERHELFAPLMPLAFESFDFTNFDLVISVTSEAAKGIITKPQTFHICYCLTPTRYLWSGYDEYFQGWTFKALAHPVVSYLRKWDKIASLRPDVMIAQSRAVRARIKKYYGRDSEIIYPPVDIEKFQNSRQPKLQTINNYYLVVSRLVPYKKVDLAIEAFNQLDIPLVIIGIGSQANNLKLKAKSNIKFLGQVSDQELAEYYQKARAVIFPQEEDFGLVPLEAQAAGTPVIAYQAGGALETVIDGKTGIFFEKQTGPSLIAAVRQFEKMKFNQKEPVENAKKFSVSRFKKEFLDIVRRNL